MPKNIQECMRALIAQHGSALATLRQHLEALQNDEQIDSLENLVPHINVPAEFNQDTSKSTRECCNRL
jgi:bisphosphoglycerate-dependent phosphoglycerate mutase